MRTIAASLKGRRTVGVVRCCSAESKLGLGVVFVCVDADGVGFSTPLCVTAVVLFGGPFTGASATLPSGSRAFAVVVDLAEVCHWEYRAKDAEVFLTVIHFSENFPPLHYKRRDLHMHGLCVSVLAGALRLPCRQPPERDCN